MQFPLFFETFANVIVKRWYSEFSMKWFLNCNDIFFVSQLWSRICKNRLICNFWTFKTMEMNTNPTWTWVRIICNKLEKLTLIFHMLVICVVSDHCYSHKSIGKSNYVCIFAFFNAFNYHNFKNLRIVVVSIVMMKSNMMNYFFRWRESCFLKVVSLFTYLCICIFYVNDMHIVTHQLWSKMCSRLTCKNKHFRYSKKLYFFWCQKYEWSVWKSAFNQ